MNEQPQELIPQNLIRTETALSRFPLHRIAKRGNVSIEITRTKPSGELKTKWEVSYNSKYGQPGPLAYKLDTLIINRRIEEAGKPVPKFLKLGSLRDICEELGFADSGNNKTSIKKALRQNAFAGISAKVTYTATDKTERTLEADFTRYSIIFTGEKFPDGSLADAVYLVLNDIYMQVLNSAQNRPLDYDYLKELAPAPQRFYEIVSYQIFAALKYGHPHAKLIYSDYCTYSTQTRYFDWEHVRKQMHKVHAPHLKSGYIAKVHFQEERNAEGILDWTMLYTPGLKAKGEHTAAKRKPRQRRPVQLELPTATDKTGAPEVPAAAPAPTPSELTAEQESFLSKLAAKGVTETEARRLVTHRLEACRLKVPALDHLPETQGKRNRGGNVRAFIERDDWQLPPSYLEARAKAEEVAKARARRSAIEACSLCDASGFRMVSDGKTSGAKRCTHNAEIEARYPGL
jgi:hypothetical protein